MRANNSIGYFLPAMGGVFGQVMVAAGEGVAGNKHIAGRIGYAAGPVSVAVSYGSTETANALDWKRFNVGGSYKIGDATLMAQYNTSDGGATGEIAHILLGGTMGFGASTIKASYVKSDGKKALSTRDATQFAFGYQYDLSKRTAVYATFARVANDGTAVYTITPIAGFTQAAGKNSTGYEFGVRHSF